MILPVWVKPALLGVALLAAAYSGYHYRDLRAQRDTLKFQVEAQETAKNYTAQLVSISNMLEKEAIANEKKHDAELEYYRDLVEQSGGLFDNGATSSPTTGGASNNTGTPSGTKLSEGAAAFLLEQANKADRVVDQYLTCQKYAREIHGGAR